MGEDEDLLLKPPATFSSRAAWFDEQPTWKEIWAKFVLNYVEDGSAIEDKCRFPPRIRSVASNERGDIAVSGIDRITETMRILRALLSLNYRPVTSDAVHFHLKNDLSVQVHGDLDKSMKEACERIGDVIVSILVIQKVGEHILKNISISVTCRKVVSSILETSQNTMQQFLKKLGVRREHVTGRRQELADYLFSVSYYRRMFLCFADIIILIEQRKVHGGQVINLIDQIREMREYGLLKDELWKLREVAWNHYRCLLHKWLSNEDQNEHWNLGLEFFIWPREIVERQNDIFEYSIASTTSVPVEEKQKDEELYRFIPELCPAPIRAHAEKIFIIEKSITSFSWNSMSLQEFHSNIDSFVQQFSKIDLAVMKSKCNIEDAIRAVYTTVTNYHCINIVNLLTHLQLLKTPVHEMNRKKKRELTRLGLTQPAQPCGVTFKFDAVKENIMLLLAEENHREMEFTPEATMSRTSVTSESSQDSNAADPNRSKKAPETVDEAPELPERLVIVTEVSPTLERILPATLLSRISMVFHIRMRLELAISMLNRMKASMIRGSAVYKEQRPVLRIIQILSSELERGRVMVTGLVTEFMAEIYGCCSKCESIEELVTVQLHKINHILKVSGRADLYYTLTIAEELQKMVYDQLGADYFIHAFQEWEGHMETLNPSGLFLL